MYSNPARSSGWLEQKEWALSPAARDLVDSAYLPALEQVAGRNCSLVVDLLRGARSKLDLSGRHERLAKAVAGLMKPLFTKPERIAYWRHLVEGGPGDSTEGLQPLLAGLMAETAGSDPSFDRLQLRDLEKRARRKGGKHELLANRLSRIDRLESLLVPSASAFGFLLARHGKPRASVAAEIGKAWQGAFDSFDPRSFQDLAHEITEAYGDAKAGERWVALASALAGGRWSNFVDLLLEQNAFVMRSRHAAEPWVRIRDGKLDVRFRDESTDLRPKGQLATSWRSNFFLDPLKAMIVALGGRP